MIKGAHVVAFPFPAGGHLARFFPFAKSLARNGLTITFITTIPHLANARRALVVNNSVEARENIRLVCFDLPAEYAEVNRKNFIAMIQVTNNMRDQLSELMTALMKPNGVTSDISQSSDSRFGPPVCIISDMFLAWTQDIADEFKIPRYCLFPTPHLLSLLYSLRDFNAQGLLPVPSDGKSLEIPCFPPIVPSDLPSNLPSPGLLVYEGERLWEAAGVLVNSVYELESEIIDGLQEMICKHSTREQVSSSVQPLRQRLQFAQDNNECLHWLNKQPESSVLFICFGTISVFPMEQMHEFASGLEASGVRFLWVVKIPAASSTVNGLSPITSTDQQRLASYFPKSFMERTKDKGLIYTSWAPQLQILAHPTIGGFLTHCGWNSVTESIAMGVPMIAWPLWADQMLNRVLCVDILHIALPVHKNFKDTVVRGEEVERVIRLLMEDKRGQAMKKKVEELSKVLEKATGPGGSSRRNLALFVEEVNSIRLMNK
ncbi:unnamed protein product [Sphagnum compactum]